MFVFNVLPVYPKSKPVIDYNYQVIKIIDNTLYLELGTYKEFKKNYYVKKGTRKKRAPNKSEFLEYELGLYRMFPMGKQFQYHMQFLHVPGVTERSIR